MPNTAKKSARKPAAAKGKEIILYKLDLKGKEYIGTTALKGREVDAAMQGRVKHYWYLARAETKHYGKLPETLASLKSKEDIKYSVIGTFSKAEARDAKMKAIAKNKPELNTRYSSQPVRKAA